MPESRKSNQSISIHSLRMEGDGRFCRTKLHLFISIHSLRMEGDTLNLNRFPEKYHFNPLPPHGGRRFLSSSCKSPFGISIHSLRMEGD